MRKRIISWKLAIVMLLSLMPTMSVETHAATISSYEPYPNIETAYTASVQCGTVRYISQTSSSTYFNDAYWGSWKSQAGIECGTACISMALSYIGVNKTPKDILDAGQGSTYFGWTWGDGVAQSYTANDLGLTTAVNNYITGRGKYSPPIIHLNSYSGAGHFVAIIGRVSSNTYQVIDPGNSVVTWQITINGSNATYKHPKTGKNITDSIDKVGRTDDIYQYYNANATLPANCIENEYPSYVQLLPKDGAKLWNMPCSDKTSDQAQHIDTTKAGDELTATALYLNTAGNYWYRVTYNGRECYIYGGNILDLKPRYDDIKIENVVAPSNVQKGKVFVIEGNITSQHNLLEEVAVHVSGPKNLDGVVNGQYRSYSLRGSDIDKALTFNTLPVGSYSYSIDVALTNYYTEDGENLESAGVCLNLHRSDFTVTEGGSSSLTDTTAPVISDVQIVSVDENGYTVSCKVTDNTGVNRVQFPTWTDNAGGQDDIQPNWSVNPAASGTRDGDTYTYRVNIADHNYETSNYMTHIYAYDNYGNASSVQGELDRIEVGEREYTVTFDANGGNCSTDTKTVTAGSAIGELPIPTRVGYDFAGWYPNILYSNANEITPSTVVNSDVTYYALWANEVYKGHKITFDANGGTLSGAANVAAVNAFNGERSSGYVVVYNCDGTIVATNEYGVEFVVNHTGEVGHVRNYGETYSTMVPSGGFVMSIQSASSSFGTWCEEVNIGDYIGYSMINGEVYVYRYESEDAYLANHKYVSSSESYGNLPVPTREGYLFDGWYTEASGGTKVTPDTQWLVSTLYAHWRTPCNHEYVATEDIVEDCEAIGYMTLYTCRYCGDFYYDLQDKVAGHDWSAWRTTKEPTHKSEGEKTRTCQRNGCGATETASIPKLEVPQITKLESTDSGIKITWDAFEGAGRYQVLIKVNEGDVWDAVGETTDTSFTYTNVKAGQSYTFTVAGLNADGSAYVSTWDTTGWTHTYSPKPAISKLESTASGIKLTWREINGAAQYRVFVKTSKGWAKVGDTTGTSLVWTGAKTGVSYTFTVRCLNAAGTAFTSSYNATGWKYTYSPAPMISGFKSAANGLQISWKAVNGAAKYRVFVKTSKGWTKAGDTTGTSFVWTGAKTGVNYTFTVRCLSADGKSFTSAYNTAGWKYTYSPAPVISGFKSAANGLQISWKPINGAAKYRVFVKTSKGWAKVGDTTGTSLVWTGAKTGVSYTFTVRCLNAAGTAFTSSYNTTGWKGTYSPAPAVKLANTTKGIQISWGKINGAAKYRVFVKTSKGWATLGDTTGTSFVWTGAKAGLTYTFTVRCVNAAGTAYTSSYNTAGWSIKRSK